VSGIPKFIVHAWGGDLPPINVHTHDVPWGELPNYPFVHVRRLDDIRDRIIEFGKQRMPTKEHMRASNT
jgi:hypothetical protein